MIARAGCAVVALLLLPLSVMAQPPPPPNWQPPGNPLKRDLHVHLQGTGSGSVTSALPFLFGIQCGQDQPGPCGNSFPWKADVKLSAFEGTGYLTQWGGCDDSKVDEGTCKVNMGSNRDVYVTFTRPVLNVHVTGIGKVKPTIDNEQQPTCSSTTASGTTTCNYRVDAYSRVTLLRIDDGIRVLNHWAGTCTGRSADCSFVTDAAANFDPYAYFSNPFVELFKTGNQNGTLRWSFPGVPTIIGTNPWSYCGPGCPPGNQAQFARRGTTIQVEAVDTSTVQWDQLPMKLNGSEGACSGRTCTFQTSITTGYDAVSAGFVPH